MRDLAEQRFGTLTEAGPELGGCLAFAPDGLTLACSGKKGRTIVLWDTVNAQTRAILRGHRTEANCLAFSPDGRTLASGHGDGTITLWNMPTGQELLTLQGTKGRILSLAFSPDGRALAASGLTDHERNTEVWLWLTADGPQGGARSR